MKKTVMAIPLFLLVIALFMIRPDLTVSGVENKKVYAGNPVITFHNTYGPVKAILNGKKIQSGHTIEENGTYKLIVEGKFLWAKKKVTKVFSRDNIQPSPPLLENPEKKVYYREIPLKIFKQKNARFKVKVNGKEHNPSVPIKGEGGYHIEITATKNNGLTSSSEYFLEIDNRTYTKEEVDNFIELYFHDPSLTEPADILKWTDTVAVVPDGTLTAEDKKTLENTLGKFNKLLPLKLEMHPKADSGNYERTIEMHYVPGGDFSKYGYEEPDPYTIGATWYDEAYYDTGFAKSTILISTDDSQFQRDRAVLHEFMHVLGLYNHEKDKLSILYPSTEGYANDLSERDQKMIEILYRDDLKIGMGEEEVRGLLSERMK